ncbi:hypothetical protein QQF64_035789 [Cirrhinus molitorella]|uniref:C-type lectin domain-containing protein n=1 Tax=Cirrhinus molitorella TaxID=172907 RepID=A0ABR3NH87_9TELE
MELEDFYNNAKWINVKDTNGPQRHLKEEKAQSCRGRRCLVAIIVCLGVICLLLIAAIILQHFQATSKRGYLWGPDGLFMSDELKSWSDSRQYCKDRGGDLVIINSEEKQRLISPLIKERVWIGLSDRETKGNMKWVDNSPLKQVFWAEEEIDVWQFGNLTYSKLFQEGNKLEQRASKSDWGTTVPSPRSALPFSAQSTEFEKGQNSHSIPDLSTRQPLPRNCLEQQAKTREVPSFSPRFRVRTPCKTPPKNCLLEERSTPHGSKRTFSPPLNRALYTRVSPPLNWSCLQSEHFR